ncbi:MAG: hypothetical protein DHS20C18_21690 [Saprospiraceae bacterium]|nr:MAG: hypothetical protein DHS20C18_21690 [Saprospiraceae bacterium]
MIVKDINAYIRFLTGKEPTQQLGSQKTDPLLAKLIGDGQQFEDYIRDLYDFAINPDIQVFFEMLQNANDEEADNIFFFFSEDSLLIINNGYPFETNGGEKRQLRHFLAKGQGRKSNDLEATGEKGRGSKLLFNLLLNEKVNEDEIIEDSGKQLWKALIEDLKGPILFSWGSRDQIEKFRFINSVENINFSGDYESSNIPLLAKLVYSYYPAFLNQKMLTNSDVQRNIFSEQELLSCIAFLNRAFAKFSMDPFFKKGTLIYVPLGSGKASKLEKQLEDEIIPGIRSSFPFLRNLKTVRINDQEINRGKYLPVELLIRNQDPFKLLIPADSSDNLVNFYQTFPIADTKFGLKFIINAKSYNIKGDRQRIDVDDSYNRQELEAISKAIINYITEFKDKKNCIDLLNALLQTDTDKLKQQLNFYQEHFYQNLRQAFQISIPIEYGGTEKDKEKVKALKSEVMVKPETLGLDHIYWLDHRVASSIELASEFLEIDIWSIINVLAAANPSLRDQWLHSLSSEKYENLLHEISDLELKEEELKGVPFFRFSDKKAYSWKEIQELEEGFLLDERTQYIKDVLTSHKIPNGGLDILANQKLAQTVSGWLLSTTLFTQIQSYIDKLLNSEENKLTQGGKWKFWKTLKDGLELSTEELRNELLLFANAEGTVKPLSSLLEQPRKKAKSGLLQFSKLVPTEYLTELDSYLLQETEYWDLIKKNWENATSQVLSTEESIYFLALSELTDFYNFRGKKDDSKLSEDVLWIRGDHENVLSVNQCFLHAKALDLNPEDYQRYKALIEQVSDLKCPPQNISQKVIKVPFANIRMGSWELLVEKWKDESHLISQSDVGVLSKMGGSFFYHFLLSPVEKGYKLSLKQSKEFQYFSEDDWVNKRLHDEAFSYLLPSELNSYFLSDESLIRTGNGLFKKLIDEIGAEHAFVRLVEQEYDIQLIKRYLTNLPVLALLSSDERESLRAEVEGKIVERLNKAIDNSYLSREEAQAKITVDGLPLREYIYLNDVVFKSENTPDNNKSFKLSDLLPEYTKKVQAIEAIRQQFRGVLGRLFEVTKMEPKEVFENLKRFGTLINPEQVAFLVAYAQFINSTTLGLECEVFQEISDQQILNSLYQHQIFEFDAFPVFSTFQPRTCFSTVIKQELRLSQEAAPEWLDEWIISDNDQVKKKEYLIGNGFPGKESDIVKLRRALLDNDFLPDASVKKAVEEHPDLSKNTFEWFESLQINSIPIKSNIADLLTKLCIAYYQAKENLPVVLTYHLSGELNLTDFNEQKVITAEPNGIKVEEMQIWLDIAKELNRLLLFNDLAEVFQERLDILSISSAYARNQILPPEPWRAAYYVLWRDKEAPEYAIFTTSERILLDYSYTLNSDQVEAFRPYRMGKHNRQKVSDQEINLYLHMEAGDTVLSLLYKYRNNLFVTGTDKDKLSRLQDLALRELEGQTAKPLDLIVQNVIEKQGFSPEEVVKILEEHKEGKVLEGITEMEREKMQENIGPLKTILGELTPEQLGGIAQSISLHKDISDQENDHATPNQIIGYIGECLIFHYLKLRGISSDVQWTAIQNPPTPEYDITLKSGLGEVLIDVKTTIKPIRDMHESAAFYIKRSQIDFLKEKQPENYWIIRVSLLDLSLKHIYSKLQKFTDNQSKEEIINANAAYVEDEISKYLKDSNNEKNLIENMLAFRVSRPGEGVELPF